MPARPTNQPHCPRCGKYVPRCRHCPPKQQARQPDLFSAARINSNIDALFVGARGRNSEGHFLTEAQRRDVK